MYMVLASQDHVHEQTAGVGFALSEPGTTDIVIGVVRIASASHGRVPALLIPIGRKVLIYCCWLWQGSDSAGLNTSFLFICILGIARPCT